MIYAISGFKGSGKDEFFKTIQELDPSYQKLAFADPIKNKVMEIFSLYSDEDYDKFKRADVYYWGGQVTGRHVLREIGMLMRSYDVDQFTRYVYNCLTDNTCITDLRFDNELYLTKVLRRDGKQVRTVKIKRFNSDDTHITEQELPDFEFDYIINNNGTLEEFKQQIERIYNENSNI